MDKDIEPTTEGKDSNHHTAYVSPNLKEKSLGVENKITGPITVAADTNERRGLGTGFFGSVKVTPSYLFWLVLFNIHAGLTKDLSVVY